MKIFPVFPERRVRDDQFHGVTVHNMEIGRGLFTVVIKAAATLGKQLHGQGVTFFIQGFLRHVMVVHLFRKCSDAVTASLLGNRFESGFERSRQASIYGRRRVPSGICKLHRSLSPSPGYPFPRLVLPLRSCARNRRGRKVPTSNGRDGCFLQGHPLT